MRRRIFPTRVERAYIRLYNGRITANRFVDTCGIKGRAKAWETLCEYRKKVVAGEIPDPRDTYNRWR